MKKFTETYYQDFKTICHYCAIISFGFGTLLFLLFLTSKSDKIVGLGLYFTLIALAINSLLFVFNTFFGLFSKEYWKKYLLNSGILLINLPITFLYLYIVLEILDF